MPREPLKIPFRLEALSVLTADGQLDHEVTIACGGAPAQPTLTLNGRTLTIEAQCASPNCLTAALHGLVGSDGTPMEGAGSVHAGLLVGDANNDAKVNNFDILSIRGKMGQPADAGNYRADINANGLIDAFDILAARGRLGQSVTCP